MILRLTALRRSIRQIHNINMPTTRSASRGAISTVAPEEPAVAPQPRATKRKASGATVDAEPKAPKKRATKATKSKVESVPAPSTVGFEIPPVGDAQALELLPAKLTFSFDEAKAHLIKSDSRFADVFARQMCKPFEKLDRVEPFKYVGVMPQTHIRLTDSIPRRTLTSSIMHVLYVQSLQTRAHVLYSGQQISWLAARSVRHKFIRLYYPELPEKPDDE